MTSPVAPPKCRAFNGRLRERQQQEGAPAFIILVSSTIFHAMASSVLPRVVCSA